MKSIINTTDTIKFKDPVLLLIFNRPKTTAVVFEKIRQLKPSRLYIAGDGPRQNNNDTLPS